MTASNETRLPEPALGTPVLYELVRPAASWPLPAAFDAAEAVFARAQAAYQASDARQAARLFMTVAATLQRDQNQPGWEGFAANRRLAYANAALAWSVAGARDEARQALAAAAVDDPICADAIDQLLARLD
jgi:hypothetical protein